MSYASRLSIFFVLFFILTPSTFAEIPWKPMLQGLLQRQYFDVAIDYLDSLRDKDDTPAELKEQIDYLAAKVHLDAITQKKAPLGMETHLARAKTLLERFLHEYPEAEDAYRANRDLGQLHLDEVRRIVQRIHAPQSDASQKELLRKQGEETIEEAQRYFQRAERLAYHRAKELQSDPEVKSDSAKLAKRDATYVQVMESRTLLATIPRERAQLHEPGSDEFQTLMDQAATELHNFVQKYRNYSESLDAKLLEAKSLFDLKRYSQARALAMELNVLTDSTPRFRNIIVQAFQLILELNLLEPTQENLEDSLERLKNWTEATAPQIRATPIFAKTNLLAGKTYLKYIESKTRTVAGETRKLQNRAVEFFKAVAPGTPEAEEVITILSSLGDTVFSGTGESDVEPTSFYEAKILAEKSFQDFMIAQKIFLDATGPEDRQSKNMNRTKIADISVTYFRMADELRKNEDEKVDEEEINAFRLKLAIIFWTLNRWEDVIVIGDFFMQRYADTAWGPRGAELSIKAARQVFLEEKIIHDAAFKEQDSEIADDTIEEDELKNLRDIESRIIKTYDYIVARFPSLPIARDALSIRIETELELGNFDKALQLLEILREDFQDDTGRQATVELNFGCALWDLYVRNRTQTKDTPIPGECDDAISLDSATKNHGDTLSDPQVRERILSETQSILQRGLQTKKTAVESGTPLDFATVSAGVTLAQVHVTRENPDAALDTLNDPVIGPMTLLRIQRKIESPGMASQTDDHFEANIERFSSVLTSPQWADAYQAQVFGVALRIAMESKPEVLPDLLPELSRLLDNYSDANQSDDATKVLGTLVYFGQLLDARLRTLSRDVDTAEAERIKPVLDKILERLANHRTILDEKSLLWYAGTLYRVGAASPEKSFPYFQRAEQIYVQLLRRIDVHDAMNQLKRDALRFQLALVRRSLGRFDDAYELLTELLSESEDQRNVQIEAARTLQMRGVATLENQPGDSQGNEDLVKAIVGDRKKEDGQYLVWGFNGVIKRVSPHFADFTNEYFEAYHGRIMCRIFLTRNLPQPAADAMIRGAKNDLARLRQLHPNLGGPEWQKRFETLEEQF